METQSRSMTKSKSRKAKRGKKAGSPKHEAAGDDDSVRPAETATSDDADEFFDADPSIVESPADIEVEAEPTIRHLGSDDGTYFDTVANELAAHEADDADESLMDAVAADAEARAESEAAEEPLQDTEMNEATKRAEERTEDALAQVTRLNGEDIGNDDVSHDGDSDAGALEASDVASAEPSTAEETEINAPLQEEDTTLATDVADEALPSDGEADDTPRHDVVTEDASTIETADDASSIETAHAVQPFGATADDVTSVSEEATTDAPSLQVATDAPSPLDDADDSDAMETLDEAIDATPVAELKTTDEDDDVGLPTLDDAAATDVDEAQDGEGQDDVGTGRGDASVESLDDVPATEIVVPDAADDDISDVENSEDGDDGRETSTMPPAEECAENVVECHDEAVDDGSETSEVVPPSVEDVLGATHSYVEAEAIADGIEDDPATDLPVQGNDETQNVPNERGTVDVVETMVAPVSMDDDDDNDAVVPPPAPVTAPHPVTERLLSGQTQFEGVLNPGHDSESDSEDDDAESTPVPEPLNLRAAQVDDDDELEVNVEIAQTITKAAPANPLANAMATAVAETAKAPETAVAPETMAFPAFDEAEKSASADVFGIAYEKVQRPTASATAGYSIGDGFDEPDIPLYSAKSTRDDSGIDDFEVVELQPSQVLDVEKTRAALQARDQASERALLEQMQAATRAERSANARSDAPVVTANSIGHDAPLSTGPTVLAEMHDMYKRGLGDQEVAQGMTAMAPTPSHELLEEDEDAMDEEDDRECRAMAQQRQEEMAHQAEWEHLQTFQEAPRETAFRTIKWNEALEHFGSASYCLGYREAIVVADDSGRRGCFACFRGPTLAFPMASNQRELLFCIAMCSFNSAIPEHYRMLQTVYQKITHCRNECPLTGSHWEVLGFQGNDPATDLRGAGMLALLQVLYLIENHHEISFFIFHYASKHEEHHFPMMCVLINMTLHTMLALRSGALIPACNRFKDVAAGMNQLYVSMVVKLLSEWQTKACADAAFPMVMKDVLDLGKDNPLRLIAEMEHVIHTFQHQPTTMELDGEVVDFTDIE